MASDFAPAESFVGIQDCNFGFVEGVTVVHVGSISLCGICSSHCRILERLQYVELDR